jgi:hypothetical protein
MELLYHRDSVTGSFVKIDRFTDMFWTHRFACRFDVFDMPCYTSSHAKMRGFQNVVCINRLSAKLKIVNIMYLLYTVKSRLSS